MQLFSRPLPHYLTKIMPAMTTLLQIILATNAYDQCFVEQRYDRHYKAHSDRPLNDELLPYFSDCNASKVSCGTTSFNDHSIWSQQTNCQSLHGAMLCQKINVYPEKNTTPFDRAFAHCLESALNNEQPLAPSSLYIAIAFFAVSLISIMFCIKYIGRLQQQQQQPPAARAG